MDKRPKQQIVSLAATSRKVCTILICFYCSTQNHILWHVRLYTATQKQTIPTSSPRTKQVVVVVLLLWWFPVKADRRHPSTRSNLQLLHASGQERGGRQRRSDGIARHLPPSRRMPKASSIWFPTTSSTKPWSTRAREQKMVISSVIWGDVPPCGGFKLWNNTYLGLTSIIL